MRHGCVHRNQQVERFEYRERVGEVVDLRSERPQLKFEGQGFALPLERALLQRMPDHVRNGKERLQQVQRNGPVTIEAMRGTAGPHHTDTQLRGMPL